MKRKIEEYKYKASTRDYLVALSNFPCFVKLLNATNKPYLVLHAWLLSNESSLLDENRTLPSIKELSQTLGIDSGKITRYLKMMYDEIHELNEKEPDKFKQDGQTLCYLSFNYLGQYVGFNLGLSILPKIGEGFDFYFIKPQNGGSNFYVKSVNHHYDNMRHTISIQLTYELPNLYMQLLREKAYLNHDISLHDYLSEPSFSLQEKLVKWYRNL